MTISLILRNLYYEFRWWLDRRFDRQHCVDTSGQTRLREMSFDSANKEHGIRYESPAASRVRSMLRELPAEMGEFTFVDFGSGKGRALLLAAELNFKGIRGVEFAPTLHVTAEQNIRSYRNRRQRCFDLQSVHGDAGDFPIPDGPCVFYFYDPFRAPVMGRVLANITSAYHAKPRKMYLIYCCPVHRGLVEQTGIFHLKPTHQLPFSLAAAPRQYAFVMFETKLESQERNPSFRNDAAGTELATREAPGPSIQGAPLPGPR